MREGGALLQGLATCGQCGRRLKVYYPGKNASPGYYCPGRTIANGRGFYCLRVGGGRIDDAVAGAFLDVVKPAGIEAALEAEKCIGSERDAALGQWRLEVERARYEADLAERRYRAVDPENRLVARGLEAEWERRLREFTAAEAELSRREQKHPRRLSAGERKSICLLGTDLGRVWRAKTTADRDRKELLRTLIEEVIITLKREEHKAKLTLRWKGGLITDLDVNLRRGGQSACRTDEGTIDLIRRLAAHYPDANIAGILNRQGRKTARGARFTADRIKDLRRNWKIPRFVPPAQPAQGELVTVVQAAKILNVASTTVHRWLAEGFLSGEQITPGAPWRIRITDELLESFVESEPEGYLPMSEATKVLGVSRQTVLQRVKRGELEAVHVRRGRRKGLRINVASTQPGLFDQHS